MIIPAIRLRLLAAFALVLTIFAFSTLVSLIELQRAERTRAGIISAYEVVVALERAQASLFLESRTTQTVVDTPAGVQAVLSDSVHDALVERLLRLASLLGDDQQQHERLAAITPLVWQLRETSRPGESRRDLIDGIRAQLADMERAQLDAIEQRRAELAMRHQRVLYLSTGLLAIGALLGMLVAVVTGQRLTGPLVQLARLMQRLAGQDHNFEVPFRSRSDEVGAIANALEVFKGLTTETERHGWVKNAVAKLMVRVQETSEPSQFAEVLLEELRTRFNLQLASFYEALPRRDGLQRVAGLGELNPERATLQFSLKDRMVQVAADGKPLILAPPPPGYPRIARDPAAPAPEVIVLVPLVTGTQLLAVVELAGSAPIDRRHPELLNELTRVLGLTLQNLRRGVQTRLLLQETREQSEKLRASEAELQMANEALREKEEIARHRATHDGLTGLPNRALFLDRLESALQRTRRNKEPLVLMYLDLDGFKAVNDGLGHLAGDALLVAVAGRLRERLRGGDTVARLGGDEFGVLLESASPGVAPQLAQQICDSLSLPFELVLTGQPPREARIGTSIGIVAGSGNEDTADGLIRAADDAMYAAKRAGKNCWVMAGAEKIGTVPAEA